jgi:hypothetical protein
MTENQQLYRLEKLREDEAAKTDELDEAGLLDEESDLDLTLHAVGTVDEAAFNLEVARMNSNAFYANNKNAVHELGLEEHLSFAYDKVGQAYAEGDVEALIVAEERLENVQKALGSAAMDDTHPPSE